MARNFTVRNGSNFCRDCGGEMIKDDGQSWCVNIQVNKCIALKRDARNYCEFCGLQPMFLVCVHCKNVAYNP